MSQPFPAEVAPRRARLRLLRILWLLLLGLPHAPLGAQDSARVRLAGYLQPRFQSVGDSAAFLLRRARFSLEGRATADVTFRIQVELRTIGAPATPTTSPLTISATDVFARGAHGPWTATVGQFRVPFSLEALTSSTVLETTERARAVLFGPNRDIGVTAEWHWGDRLSIAGAMVNGEGPNRGSNPDRRFAVFGRAAVRPVRALGLGAAIGAYPDSTDLDFSGEWHAGRWVARAEYVDARSQTTGRHRDGWYTLGAFMAVPNRLEVVGRVQEYSPADTAFNALAAMGYLLGTQYFMRGDDLKVMADYEVFRERAAELSNNRAVVQFQVRW